MSQLKEDLDRTYLELELNGWCQGVGRDKICLEEAVAIATGHTGAEWPERSDPRQVAVLRALHVQAWPQDDCGSWASHIADDRLALWGWNDQPYRTVDEVKALIKAAWEVA